MQLSCSTRVLTRSCLRCPQESTLEATTETLTTANELLPPLKNPPLLESQEDLANLSNLNEPSGKAQISSHLVSFIESRPSRSWEVHELDGDLALGSRGYPCPALSVWRCVHGLNSVADACSSDL